MKWEKTKDGKASWILCQDREEVHFACNLKPCLNWNYVEVQEYVQAMTEWSPYNLFLINIKTFVRMIGTDSQKKEQTQIPNNAAHKSFVYFHLLFGILEIVSHHCDLNVGNSEEFQCTNHKSGTVYSLVLHMNIHI